MGLVMVSLLIKGLAVNTLPFLPEANPATTLAAPAAAGSFYPYRVSNLGGWY